MSIIEGKVILGGITIIKMTVVIEKTGYIITISQKILIKIQNIKAVLSRNNFLYIGRKQLDKKGYYDPMINQTHAEKDRLDHKREKEREKHKWDSKHNENNSKICKHDILEIQRRRGGSIKV